MSQDTLIEWYANGQPRSWDYEGWRIEMFGIKTDWEGRAENPDRGDYVTVRRDSAEKTFTALMENIDALRVRPLG